MTQTMNGQSNEAQKRTRPGQRQQERLQRLARRKRRRQIWTSVIVALVVVVLALVGFLQYQSYTNHQHDLSVAATSTATIKANVQATASVNAKATAVAQAAAAAFAQGMQTVTAGSPTPSAGPATPPAVSGTPVKLADGLQYIDLKVGQGATVQSGSAVQVEYTGWLQSSGKKFDSSYDRNGSPIALTIGQHQVIPGWEEGLTGMKAGGTRRLIIPAALGYGAKGSPPVIPANAVLVFDVTLVTVQNP